ncbi:hypothetical protein GQ457_08G007450 [Hibiscus cannabinus]
MTKVKIFHSSSTRTLTLIIPLSFVYLVYIQFYSLFLIKSIVANYHESFNLISYHWLTLIFQRCILHFYSHLFVFLNYRIGPIQIVGLTVLTILVILFIMGFLYLINVSHLTITIYVLEEAYEFPTMMKSKNMIKGEV